MGCCFSKKRKKHPASDLVARRCQPEARDPPPPASPEEEKVKEVLSETPKTKRRQQTKPVAYGAGVEQEEEKAKAKADAIVSDLGSAVSLATDEKSEVASESSAATTVAGPERSPLKPARKRPVSGELGRDRARSVSGVGSRASPSPPPRRDLRERSSRRTPSPAAKRPPEQRRVACAQRKPPVPARPYGRMSPRRAEEAPRLSLPPPPQPEDDANTVGDERSIADATAGDGAGEADGGGKESLENPLVSLECFIFL